MRFEVADIAHPRLWNGREIRWLGNRGAKTGEVDAVRNKDRLRVDMALFLEEPDGVDNDLVGVLEKVLFIRSDSLLLGESEYSSSM